MENLPPEKYVTIEDDPTSETGLTVKNVSSLIDCRLTVGPGYVNKDFHFKWASDHGIYTSGLCGKAAT